MASIERIKTKLGKKTVIKFPVTHGYFVPEYVRKEAKTAGKKDKFKHDYTGKLKPILVDLKTGSAVEDERLEYLPALDDRPCAVAGNSEENPIRLTYDPDSKTRCVNVTEYISILEYKDTGNIAITLTSNEICWIRSKERVFRRKKSIHKLTIRHGGKTTMTENGVMCLTNTALVKAFNKMLPLMRIKYIARYRGYVILRKMFIKHWFGLDKMSASSFERVSVMDIISIYRVKQNPQLNDLPWTESELSRIYDSELCLSEENRQAYEGERSVSNVKVSLNRYLRRGDTKQAIEACFYGFTYPKSIKKVLLKTLPLEFQFIDYKNLFDLVQLHGVDNARNFITQASGVPNKANITNPHYMRLLELGFSWQQVSQHDRYYMRDVIDMHFTLLEDEGFTLDFVPNLAEYHDYLTRLTVELDAERRELRGLEDEEWVNRDTWQGHAKQRRQRLELAFSTIDTSEQMPRFEKNDLVFRSPLNSNELTAVGRFLRICVGSYREIFFLGKVDIVLVTKVAEDKTEKYIACLEIRRGKLVQAKQHSNKAVFRNLPLMKIVKQWAVVNNIKLATADVGIRGSNWVKDNPVRIDRMEFLAAENKDGDTESEQ